MPNLETAVETKDIVSALLEQGLAQQTIAAATGASDRSVRNSLKHSEILRTFGCEDVHERQEDVTAYLVGLTATPQRRDGHHPITEMQLGPVRFRVDAKGQAGRAPFEH